MLQAERPFDTIYTDTVEKMQRVTIDIQRTMRQIDNKKVTLSLLEKEIEGIENELQARGLSGM